MIAAVRRLARSRGHHLRAGVGARGGLGAARGRHGDLPAGSTVLLTLSGRGDKDMAPTADAAHGGAARAKLLIPYVTGGVTADWTDYLRAYEDAGADAIEIGLPFSDPMLDGADDPGGVRPRRWPAAPRSRRSSRICPTSRPVDVPLIVMTYANLVAAAGPAAFCARLAAAGLTGLIVPDLPLDELGGGATRPPRTPDRPDPARRAGRPRTTGSPRSPPAAGLRLRGQP